MIYNWFFFLPVQRIGNTSRQCPVVNLICSAVSGNFNSKIFQNYFETATKGQYPKIIVELKRNVQIMDCCIHETAQTPVKTSQRS